MLLRVSVFDKRYLLVVLLCFDVLPQKLSFIVPFVCAIEFEAIQLAKIVCLLGAT